MIKKLKIKFVITNMSLIFAVLITIFSIFTFRSYMTAKANLESSLRYSLERHTTEGLDIFDKRISKDVKDYADKKPVPTNAPSEASASTFVPPYIGKHNDMPQKKMAATVTVELDSMNKLVDTFSNNASIAEDTLQSAIDIAVSSDKPSDNISSLSLYYYKQSNSGTTYISFCDSSNLESTLKDSLVTYLCITAICLVAFLVISIILAKMTVKPVEIAFKRQQQFVADASHELKTPLTVILANNNILKSHLRDPVSTQQKWIDSTEDEALQMKSLVDDLLFLARSDAKVAPTIQSEFNLSDLTENSLLQFEPVAFEKNVILDSDIENGINLIGDSGQLKQLIHILLDNACKYSGNSGHVNLVLKQHSHSIHLSVNNTGSVIPKEDLEHVFERFYRSDKSRQREGGTGLGLSIAKSIVDAHHGDISVTSIEGQGTTFTVKLDIHTRKD